MIGLSRRAYLLVAGAFVFVLVACSNGTDLPASPDVAGKIEQPEPLTLNPTPTTPTPGILRDVYWYTYRVLNVYPHDSKAYTQGLVYEDGQFYEGTGQFGESNLRLVALDTGEVLRSTLIGSSYFGEGIAVVDDRIYQLTWQANKGWIYDKDTFERLDEFTYATSGWGLTYDGQYLIRSDGSHRLFFLALETFEELWSVSVLDQGVPTSSLNELEYIDGLVFANVFTTNWIVVIDPTTGELLHRIDLTNLLPAEDRPGANVLNGIAYDAATHRLFVTGKDWPKLFEIQLIPDPDRPR